MRRPSIRLAAWAIPAFAAGGIVSAVAQSTIIVAPSAPPAPRVETVPPPNVSEGQATTWLPGHWGWTGTNWAWVDGQYVARPHAAARWMPGHWEQRATGDYVWVDGPLAGLIPAGLQPMGVHPQPYWRRSCAA